MESSFNRREIFKKLIGASVGASVCQIFGVGQSNSAISAIALSSEQSSELKYEFLTPIVKRIGEGIGEFAYSIGEAGGNAVKGIGEGLRERLRDLTSNAEGKRKLQEYSLQQDFQRKREIIELMRDSLREFQDKQIDLKLTEIQSNWDLQNWNGVLSRQETEDLLKEQKDCLLILLSPPEISLDAPASIRNNLKIELNSLEAFLDKYYSEQDKQHLVKFYSDYFKRPIGNTNVEQLHKILAPVPTAILDMGISDYTYTVKVHFWGVQNNQRRFYSSNVWNWENETKELMSKGADEKEALRMVRKTIVNSNKLLAAYITDLYYLKLDPYYQFKLPNMTAEFTLAGLDKEVLNPYLTVLQNIQQTEQQAYEKELKAVVDEVKEEENIRSNAQKWRLASTLSANSVCKSIAISPDGQTIASGGNDTIQLWDLETGQLIDTLEETSSNVWCLAFSPDGQTIAADYGFGTIKLRALNSWGLTKEPIRTLEGHSKAVRSVAFTPDSQTLASGSDDTTIKLWKLRTGKLIGTLEGDLSSITSVAISPDGHTIASSSLDGTIKLWDLKTKKLIRTFEVSLEYLEGIFSLSDLVLRIYMRNAFSPDGQTLARNYKNKIKLWNVKTGKLICTLEEDSGNIFSFAFSPDGQSLASGSSDKTIKIWDLKIAKEVRTLEGHSAEVTSLAFSPNSHTLVSGSIDNTIKIWRDN